VARRAILVSVRNAFALVLAVLAIASVSALGLRPQPASADDHTKVSFVTPGRAAYCDSPQQGEVPPFTLRCWRPSNGFTIWMAQDGRVEHAYNGRNKRRFADALQLITFNQNWWSSDPATVGHPQGKGQPRGAVLYRCSSRSTGLTCRNRTGHGWWLGRNKGYRVF
jgi:hypothetical protein